MREDSEETVDLGDSVARCEVPTVEVAVAVPVLLPVEGAVFVTTLVLDTVTEVVLVDVEVKAVECVESEEAVAEFVAELDCVLTAEAVKDNCGIDVPLLMLDNEDFEEEVDEIDADRVVRLVEEVVDMAEGRPLILGEADVDFDNRPDSVADGDDETLSDSVCKEDGVEITEIVERLVTVRNDEGLADEDDVKVVRKTVPVAEIVTIIDCVVIFVTSDAALADTLPIVGVGRNERDEREEFVDDDENIAE